MKNRIVLILSFLFIAIRIFSQEVELSKQKFFPDSLLLKSNNNFSNNSGSINVSHYLQCNQTWSNNQLGNCSNATICSDGCALVCATMILTTNGIGLDPGMLNNWLNSNNGYANGCLIKWDIAATYPRSTTNYIGTANYSLSTMRNEIDNGNPIIINVILPNNLNHFILVKGYQNSGININDFIVLDPLKYTETNLSSYTIASNPALRLFHNVSPTWTITINNPSGGETWYKGTDYQINWSSQGCTTPLKIELYKGSVMIPPQITTNAPLSGSVVFNPSFNLKNGSDYRIAVSEVNGNAYKFSNYFTINGSIVISNPSGGETWYKGTDYQINWSSQGCTTPLKIELYKGSVMIPPQITTNAPLSGSVTFNPSPSLENGSDYRIAVSEKAENGIAYNFSNSFTITSPTSSIDNDTWDKIPTRFFLYQNYPNPFNPITRIRYSVPKSGFVAISLFDLSGKEVKKLVSEVKPVGYYDLIINGDKLSSGVYYCKLRSDSFVKTIKIVLIK